MNLKKFAKGILPVIALSLASFAAPAAEINKLFDPSLPGGINDIQDTDVERVLREVEGPDGQTTIIAVTTGDLMVGDVIQTILRWDTVNAGTISDSIVDGTLPLPYQFTAYSELRVDTITPVGGGSPLADITFVATNSANMQTAGSLVDFYERTSGAQPAWDIGTDPDTGISNVLGQTFLASIGFGETQDYWDSTAPLSLDLLATLGPDSPQAGQAIFGLSLLANPGNLPVANLGIEGFYGDMHDFVGNTGVYQRSPGVNLGWGFSSNATAAFQAVPAPATLALFGLGFAGMGMRMRRKKA